MTEQPETLFNEQPEAPKPKAPGLLEQIAGVFTDPIALFRRLNQTPTWGWALGAILVSAMVLTMVWAMKVDADEMLRPILERNPQITSAQIDTIIDMQKKFILPFSALGVIFGTPLAWHWWASSTGSSARPCPKRQPPPTPRPSRRRWCLVW